MDTFFPVGDAFESMKSKYGIWPLTVWELDRQDRLMQAAKELVGDYGGVRRNINSFGYLRDKKIGTKRKADWGTTREGCLKKSVASEKDVHRVTASIFNPALAQIILNCYAPESGVCFDPFGGGGTRAIVAAKNGLQYVGIEVRKEEVDAVGRRLEHCGVDGANIILGSSTNCRDWVEGASADFCYTCPPYYDLEKYEGGTDDLSMLSTYDDFLDKLFLVVCETFRILKPGAFSCWVVGLHRKKDGGLLAMNHDVADLHKQAGFSFLEEVVLHNKNSGAIQRVGQFEKGNRRLVRVHEYLMVFKKGDN